MLVEQHCFQRRPLFLWAYGRAVRRREVEGGADLFLVLPLCVFLRVHRGGHGRLKRRRPGKIFVLVEGGADLFLVLPLCVFVRVHRGGQGQIQRWCSAQNIHLGTAGSGRRLRRPNTIEDLYDGSVLHFFSIKTTRKWGTYLLQEL